ncbi:MAG: extracellular catalytic domain type 1 short-chain-length polyhydroxyalkanoate depolymerase [Telluria sp.]
MKPFDKFLQQMLASARQAGAHDAAGATETIQRALRDAGLMPGPAAPAPEPPADQFVDLNSVPEWAQRLAPKQRARARPAAPGAAPAAPAGADTAPAHGARGRFSTGRFACAAGARRYRLYVPAGPARGPRALVVMLHGCTQDAADFAAGTGMNRLADERDCVVLYPEQDRGANPNACWNWFEPRQQARDAGEPAILAALTRQVMREQDIDPQRVYVAGLSAGGAMAAILGAAYPDLFAAVGVHSGLAAGTGKDMISGLHAMKRPGRPAALGQGVPLIVFHGDADAVVHPDNGKAVLRQFVAAHGQEAAGSLAQHTDRGEAGGRTYTRTSWRAADGRHVAEHWQVHGAAHAWQGGSAAGSHTDPGGPCASGQMLAFFLDRSRARLTPA